MPASNTVYIDGLTAFDSRPWEFHGFLFSENVPVHSNASLNCLRCVESFIVSSFMDSSTAPPPNPPHLSPTHPSSQRDPLGLVPSLISLF